MMLTRSTRHTSRLCAAVALGALLSAPLAYAAGTGAASEADIQARYRLDVERCNTGQTNQDKATCLREAGAALEESKRNRLMRGNETYAQNQQERCNALPVSEREDCMLQMSGQNTSTTGSIEGGGVLRETTITVPASTDTLPSSNAMPSATTSPGVTSTPAGSLPAPALAPNPPAVVPAPSLAPTPNTGTVPAPVPGTGVAQ